MYRVYQGKKNKKDFDHIKDNSTDTSRESDEAVYNELPHFLAWLMCNPPAAWTQTDDPRYGVPCEIHPEFAADSVYTAEIQTVREIVEFAINLWDVGDQWKGTCTEFVELCAGQKIQSITKLKLSQVGIGLQMIARHEPGFIKATISDGISRYRITKLAAKASVVGGKAA